MTLRRHSTNAPGHAFVEVRKLKLLSWEEDDAVALVRVYCGLASAEQAGSQLGSDIWLTVAVVDDAGRLLDLCEVSDDAVGYAELSALLAQRSGGQSVVAVAADSDDHVVTQLLTAAGRYLAFTDDDSADDYAERFADDDSPEEIQSNPAERRAVGLARALQAGVLSAVGQSTPRDLLALKPLLAAHGAVVAGRQGTAATLREVLRELYPAALRAYPDPAEPIPLAVLDALPEPGLLGTNSRNRDDQVVAELVETGVADAPTLNEAITALRVAIAETPRRTGVNRALTTAVAETIRQSVAAVRANDAAVAALVGVLTDRTGRTGRRAAVPVMPAPTPLRPVRDLEPVAESTSGTIPLAPPRPVASPVTSPVAQPPAAAAGGRAVRMAEQPAAARAVGGRRRAQTDFNAPVVPPVSPSTGVAPVPPPMAPAASLPPSRPGGPAPIAPSGPVTNPFESPASSPAAGPMPPAPPMRATPPPPYAPATRPSIQVPVQQPSPYSTGSQPAVYPSPQQPTPVGPLPTAPPPMAPPPVAPPPVVPPMAPAASVQPISRDPLGGPTVPPMPIDAGFGGSGPAAGSFGLSTPFTPLTPPPPPGMAPLPTRRPASHAAPSEPAAAGGPTGSNGSNGFGYGSGAHRVAESSTGSGIGSSTGSHEVLGTRQFASQPPAPPTGAPLPARMADGLPTLAPAPVPAFEDPLPSTGGFSALNGLREPEPPQIDMTPPPAPSWSLAASEDPLLSGTAERRRVTAIPRLGDTARDRESTGAHSIVGDLPTRVPGRTAEPVSRGGVELPRQREGRVMPPWQSDDLPVEPPGLRLVEPAPLADPALSSDRAYSDELSGEFRFEPPALRLVESERPARANGAPRSRRGAEHGIEDTPLPADAGDDGDLLIFAAARSAWFTDYDAEQVSESTELNWGANDIGWRAAERASQPAIAEETTSGLPRRVPQQNLVPGSPISAPEEDRPLRIVRDAASIAAHTTGYFRGWRRGPGGRRLLGRRAPRARVGRWLGLQPRPRPARLRGARVRVPLGPPVTTWTAKGRPPSGRPTLFVCGARSVS